MIETLMMTMKNILFVDDEANILQGLKRMLRSQRDEWNMFFVESSKEALELLQTQAVDAVISDMRMPGMDGAQLLAEVKSLYPNTVRFILSGHSDHELVVRSVGPSHQYLSKPCEPQVLKDALTGAFALRELLASDKLRELVSGISGLPSLPDIYTRVVEEIRSPDASIMAIGKLVENDPGMTSKVLQLVNSAYFGMSRRINNATEAATFLGLDVLKNLILAEGVFSQFDASIDKIIPLESFKYRSLTVAGNARRIARLHDADKALVDQSYLSGMLLNIGSLLLASNSKDDYLRAHELAASDRLEMWQAEKEVFGASHAEVGAYTLGLWGIDSDVVTAVAYHHEPANYPSTQFSALTAAYVANACLSEQNNADDNAFPASGHQYLENLGLADQLPEWMAACIPHEEDAA